MLRINEIVQDTPLKKQHHSGGDFAVGGITTDSIGSAVASQVRYDPGSEFVLGRNIISSAEPRVITCQPCIDCVGWVG